MARLRKGVCYRRLERPYTRVSKYRHLSFVKARPHVIITKFDMGNVNGKYDVQIDLIAKDSLQVRQQPIEAVRRALVRAFDKKIGNSNYHLRIRKFPHHILRENPLVNLSVLLLKCLREILCLRLEQKNNLWMLLDRL